MAYRLIQIYRLLMFTFLIKTVSGGLSKSVYQTVQSSIHIVIIAMLVILSYVNTNNTVQYHFQLANWSSMSVDLPLDGANDVVIAKGLYVHCLQSYISGSLCIYVETSICYWCCCKFAETLVFYFNTSCQ